MKLDETKNTKKQKTKRYNAYKGYTSTYNVEILNLFYFQIDLKDTNSAVRKY